MLKDVLRVLADVVLEVLDRIFQSGERLVAVEVVAILIVVTAQRVFETAADDDAPVLAVDVEIHLGVDVTADFDVSGLVDSGNHIRADVGCDVPDFGIGEIVCHILLFFGLHKLEGCGEEGGLGDGHHGGQSLHESGGFDDGGGDVEVLPLVGIVFLDGFHDHGIGLVDELIRDGHTGRGFHDGESDGGDFCEGVEVVFECFHFLVLFDYITKILIFSDCCPLSALSLREPKRCRERRRASLHQPASQGFLHNPRSGQR